MRNHCSKLNSATVIAAIIAIESWWFRCLYSIGNSLSFRYRSRLGEILMARRIFALFSRLYFWHICSANNPISHSKERDNDVLWCPFSTHKGNWKDSKCHAREIKFSFDQVESHKYKAKSWKFLEINIVPQLSFDTTALPKRGFYPPADFSLTVLRKLKISLKFSRVQEAQVLQFACNFIVPLLVQAWAFKSLISESNKVYIWFTFNFAPLIRLFILVGSLQYFMCTVLILHRESVNFYECIPAGVNFTLIRCDFW